MTNRPRSDSRRKDGFKGTVFHREVTLAGRAQACGSRNPSLFSSAQTKNSCHIKRSQATHLEACSPVPRNVKELLRERQTERGRERETVGLLFPKIP